MLSTRARVAGLTPGLSCRARSTVPIEMPRARAMSLMPAAGAVGGRVFASDDMRLDLSELARNCVPGSYRPKVSPRWHFAAQRLSRIGRSAALEGLRTADPRSRFTSRRLRCLYNSNSRARHEQRRHNLIDKNGLTVPRCGANFLRRERSRSLAP